MSAHSLSATGRTAISITAVALMGLVFIALFFAIGGPFGTLNDICVGVGGILSARLAWMLYPMHRSRAPRGSRFVLAAAVLGACVVAVGSGLVIFKITDWFLAGLVTTFGYGLIGAWLLGLNSSLLRSTEFSRQLSLLGTVAGAVAAIGLLAFPGILARVDAAGSAPWFVSGSMYVGGLGWNILYAVWCMLLGRMLVTAGSAPEVVEAS